MIYDLFLLLKESYESGANLQVKRAGINKRKRRKFIAAKNAVRPSPLSDSIDSILDSKAEVCFYIYIYIFFF